MRESPFRLKYLFINFKPAGKCQPDVFLNVLITLFMTPALARTAYVGVASVGPDRGVLGHVFLVFAREPERWLDATFYQFAIRVPADFEFHPTEVNKLSSFPFEVESGPAWPFIKAYVDDDRAVILYELDLTETAVEDLAARAETERAKRTAEPRADFSLDHNCATRTFELVNQVAGDRPIDFGRPSDLKYPWILRSAGRIAMAVPVLLAPRLARHPLVRNHVVLRPGLVTTLHMSMVAVEEVRPLFRKCGVSDAAREVLTRTFANLKLRRSVAYVDGFEKIFAGCYLDAVNRDLYNAHLDFVRFGVTSTALVDRIDRAYRR